MWGNHGTGSATIAWSPTKAPANKSTAASAFPCSSASLHASGLKNADWSKLEFCWQFFRFQKCQLAPTKILLTKQQCPNALCPGHGDSMSPLVSKAPPCSSPQTPVDVCPVVLTLHRLGTHPSQASLHMCLLMGGLQNNA